MSLNNCLSEIFFMNIVILGQSEATLSHQQMFSKRFNQGLASFINGREGGIKILIKKILLSGAEH